MDRSFSSALASATATAAAILAVALIAVGNAYADDITVDTTPFVSRITREEVGAQLRVAYPGGNPWSSQYNMFQAASAATRDHVSREYVEVRDEVHALAGEDSGSAYFSKSAPSFGRGVHSRMGGPAR